MTPTGELRLPSGKIVGHRDFRHIYKQWVPTRDTREKEVMKKLAIEYKSMKNAVMLKRENRLAIVEKAK